MKTHISTSFILMLFVLYSSISKAQSDIEKMADLPAAQLERAAQFRNAIKTTDGKYRSGAYVYKTRSMADYEKEPEKLAARLAIMGITDVYLATNDALDKKDDAWLKWQKKFIKKSHEYNMKVHALRMASMRIYTGNEKIYEEAKRLIDYNYSVGKNERFDGVSADLEPHILKKGFVDYPKGLDLYWSNDYGKGSDNDLLLKRTVEAMKVAQREFKPLPVHQALGFFFQPRVNRGELEYGGADQFLQYCDYVLVMAYNFRKTRIWEMSEPLLAAAGDKPQSVSICIKTSMETVGDEGPVTSLQPHGWKNLLEAIEFLIEKGSGYKTFRGIDIFEFQGLEKMLNNFDEPTSNTSK